MDIVYRVLQPLLLRAELGGELDSSPLLGQILDMGVRSRRPSAHCLWTSRQDIHLIHGRSLSGGTTLEAAENATASGQLGMFWVQSLGIHIPTEPQKVRLGPPGAYIHSLRPHRT